MAPNRRAAADAVCVGVLFLPLPRHGRAYFGSPTRERPPYTPRRHPRETQAHGRRSEKISRLPLLSLACTIPAHERHRPAGVYLQPVGRSINVIHRTTWPNTSPPPRLSVSLPLGEGPSNKTPGERQKPQGVGTATASRRRQPPSAAAPGSTPRRRRPTPARRRART